MKRWYVVQVYAGYEEAIKLDLEKHIKDEGMENLFGEVLVPSAKMKNFFDVDEVKDQQLFPGYILVEVEVSESKGIPVEVLRLVTSRPRVLRFLGGKNPIPLPKAEVSRMLSQVRGEVIVSTDKVKFSIGDEVEVKEGPFAGFVGIIDKIDDESEKLTVMVSIFGRMTPVELVFSQVKR